MRLSIVLSTQPAVFSALVYRGRLAESMATIKKLGYHGVELAVRDPGLLDLVEIESLLRQHQLVVPAIGTGQAYGEEGLSLTHPDETIRQQAKKRIKAQVALAARLQAKVIIGLIRGKKESGTDERQTERWLVDALRECAAENSEVAIAIEPINRYETNIANTVNSALALLEKIAMKNVGLLLDTFHMNIEEPSIGESIIATKERLFHFHIADSNRWYPGAGHIDFAEVIGVLEKIGYEGFLSAEILPLPDPDTAAEKTIGFMSKLIS